MPLSVVDTTVVSNFAHTGQPALLRAALRFSAIITPRVLAELHYGESRGLVPIVDWGWIDVITLSPGEVDLSESFSRFVHAGEAECVAVAITRQAVFLSDDLDARRLARRQGVLLSGTLGVLQALVQREQLTLEQADSLLGMMVGAGYRSPVRSLRELQDEP